MAAPGRPLLGWQPRRAPIPGLPGGNAAWADGSGFYIPNNPYRPAHPEMFEERTRQLFGEWKQKIFDQTAMTYNVQTGKTERVKAQETPR